MLLLSSVTGKRTAQAVKQAMPSASTSPYGAVVKCAWQCSRCCGGRREQVGSNPATVPLTRLVPVANRHTTVRWALSQSPMTKESSSHIQFWRVFPPRWFFPAGGSNITCFHLHQFDGHRTATGTMFKPEDCGLMGRIAMDGDVFRRNRGWILTKIIWQRQHDTAIAWIGT